MLIEYKEEYRETLADIFYDIYYNQPFNYKWIDKDNVVRYFRDFENTPNFYGFVFVDENKIKGGCFGVVNDYFKNSKYRINEIFIDRNFQGTGRGSIFLKEVENALMKMRIEIVELVTEDRIPAFEFYKKAGYIPSEHMTYMIKAIKKMR